MNGQNNSRTEKTTTIISSIDIDEEQEDIEEVMTYYEQNRIIYGVLFALLIIFLINTYIW